MVAISPRQSTKAIILASLVFCCLMFAGCEAIWRVLRDDRRPNLYLIPEGYVGWVRIDYEVEGAPELPIEDGFYLLRIPASGHWKTSAGYETGWASDEYYYVDATGDRERIPATAPDRGGLIWREVTGGAQKRNEEDLTFIQFFVGPEELAKQQRNQGDDGEALYGPVSSSELESAASGNPG